MDDIDILRIVGSSGKKSIKDVAQIAQALDSPKSIESKIAELIDRKILTEEDKANLQAQGLILRGEEQSPELNMDENTKSNDADVFREIKEENDDGR